MQRTIHESASAIKVGLVSHVADMLSNQALVEISMMIAAADCSKRFLVSSDLYIMLVPEFCSQNIYEQYI